MVGEKFPKKILHQSWTNVSFYIQRVRKVDQKSFATLREPEIQNSPKIIQLGGSILNQ